MKRYIIILIYLLFPFTILAQQELFGLWESNSDNIQHGFNFKDDGTGAFTRAGKSYAIISYEVEKLTDVKFSLNYTVEHLGEKSPMYAIVEFMGVNNLNISVYYNQGERDIYRNSSPSKILKLTRK